MPIQKFDVIQEPVSLEELTELVAKLQKLLRYLLNGQIDFENIRARSIKAENVETGTLTANEIKANSITADRMDVDELSAISADLGHITAGLIEAVNIISSIITGSLIQTQTSGSYPRIELNSTNSVLKAEGSVNNTLSINALFPSLTMSTATSNVEMIMFLGLNILSSHDILLRPGTGYRVLLDEWSDLYSSGNSQSLQAALNSKANAFSGYTGSASVTDGGGVPRVWNFVNGVLQSVV